jgi:3-deoxy-7-phosphoheptulonate synthase
VTATTTWSPGSWRDRPTAQQPDWPDDHEVEQTLDELRTMPPLVFAGEARSLTEALGAVSERRGFVLQAGDCAESFAAFSADAIRDKLKVILQMAVVLTYGSGVPTVKIGRMAGQFAKPRSSPTETRDDVELPSYRGDLVNDFVFDPIARRADPSRLVRAYNQSAATLNLVRAFTKGGFADLSRVHAWNLEYIATSPEGRRYEVLAAEIERALRFMGACGIDLAAELQLHQVDFYTSHEALILGYEEALTRRDSLTDTWYDCSAHLVWLGDRTRQLDGAHVEFLAGVENPVGVKLGPTATPDDVVALCDRLNPTRRPGRITLVSRMGAGRVDTALPPLLHAVSASGNPVVWICDPMHGNTFGHASGFKTRSFDDVIDELHGFFRACDTADVWPGGVHVELTGEDVTECLGGSDQILGDHLEQRYETLCDPRLNARQSLELAFQVAELLRR